MTKTRTRTIKRRLVLLALGLLGAVAMAVQAMLFQATAALETRADGAAYSTRIDAPTGFLVDI